MSASVRAASPSRLGRPRVVLDIVEEHFDELDFLWELREANVFTRDWNLYDLAEHEERAEAHLDGLRLAELHAVDLARERIGSGETFVATASTLVLCAGDEPEFYDLVLETLRTADPPVVDGIRIALRHCDVKSVTAALVEMVAGPRLTAAVAALDVLAFHRVSSVSAQPFLSSADPWERTIALRAAGRLGSLRESDLTAALQHPEASVRVAAWQEAARVGLPDLADRCRAAATRGTDPDPVAVAFLGVLGDSQDLPVLQEKLRQPGLAAAAVSALGALGRVEGVPLLLELMADDALGVSATTAYRRITGATSIEGARPLPPSRRAEDTSDSEEEDEDVGDALPPDPAKARTDWERRRSQMSPDRRWQSGIPIEEDQLPTGFQQLPLESRRDVYLRLRSRKRAPDRELEALAVHQLEA